MIKKEDFAVNLLETIDLILKEVPEDNSLIQALQSIKCSTEFSAPELMGIRWRSASDALQRNIGQPVEGWQLNVLKIWQERCKIEDKCQKIWNRYIPGTKLIHLDSDSKGVIIENYKLLYDICVEWDNGVRAEYDLNVIEETCKICKD